MLHQNSRRRFIKNSMLASAGFYIIPRHVMGRGFIAPSDKLTIAGIGVGGKGANDIDHFAKSGKANIAFLCDVDDVTAADTRKKFPQAKYYKDYREMLSKESKSIDAFPFQLRIICTRWLPWQRCNCINMCMCKNL